MRNLSKNIFDTFDKKVTMQSFIEYRNSRKLIREGLALLLEMPQIDKTLTPTEMDSGADELKAYIDKNHAKSKSIGGDNFHLNHEPTGSDLYYRHTGGKVKELSFISKNTQTGVQKGEDGNSSNIHSFMSHHIQTNGVLQTAGKNTNGSKNLWINFVKKNPKLKFHYIDHTTDDKKSVNGNNIDNFSKKIWGDTDYFHKVRLVAYK